MGVAVALVLLVAACSRGPGETPAPLPSWSPPSWMHGDWTATVVMERVTMEVSAHNMVIEIRFGGEQFRFDLKQMSDRGATIEHHEQDLNGKRNYAVSIAEGKARNDFDCTEVDATTMNCSWIQVTPAGNEIQNGPFLLTKL